MRIDPPDYLAIEFEDEAQHSMRRGMLRPKVDVELADVGLWHGSLAAVPFVRPGSRLGSVPSLSVK
jgi:hypothetical protein